MEILAAFVIFLFVTVFLFMGFWIKNLIKKLKAVAEQRAEFIEVLNIYAEVLIESLENPYHSGDPTLQSMRTLTERVVKYIREDQLHEEVKFLYSTNDKK
jgi:hypothetical protein